MLFRSPDYKNTVPLFNTDRYRSENNLKQTIYGKRKKLSSEECAVVIALSKTKMSQRAKVARLNQSKTVIQHVLREHTTSKRNSKDGRPFNVSLTFSRLIVRTAKKDKLTASQLLSKLGIDASLRTVQ